MTTFISDPEFAKGKSSGPAFVCPGQGSQKVGMGLDWFSAEVTNVGKNLFHLADKILGYSLSSICFNGPAEKLNLTIYAQPALYVHDCIVGLTLMLNGAKPALISGHSLGFSAAAYLAGVYDFRTGLEFVRQRAQAVSQAVQENPGTMAAIIGLSIDEIQKACDQVKEICVVSNINSPVQTVISGKTDAVKKVGDICKGRRAKVIFFPVEGAFHSPLMQSAREKMEIFLKNIPLNNPRTALISDITGDFILTTEAIRSILSRQITESVQWVAVMERICSCLSPEAKIMEIGPGNKLTNFFRAINPQQELINCQCVNDFKQISHL